MVRRTLHSINILNSQLHQLEKNSHFNNILFHLCEAEFLGLLLINDYSLALESIENIVQKATHKDSKTTFYQLVAEAVADGNIQTAREFVAEYTDTIVGQSSVEYFYKPLLALYLDKLSRFDYLFKNN